MPTTTLFEVSPPVPTLVKAFNSVAQTYEKFRPGYPLQLQEFLETRLNMSSSSRVLDLAAGTGKVSRVLEKVCGVENLVAVEPLDGMRSELVASLPSVSAFPGTAESIPLPDASVDFVVVGDAFHWFRGQEAVAEILRVLKPGGQLCVMWNDPDVTNGPAFMKTLFFNVVGSRKPAGTPTYWSGEWKAPFQAQNSPFSPLQFQRIQHSTTMTPQQVIKFVSSLSWIAALTSEQAQIEEETCAAIAADPVNCNKDIFMVPYNTDVYWCTKL